MTYTGEQLRRALLFVALDEHETTVRSQGEEDRITEYFHRCGWQWALNETAGGRYSEEARRRRPDLLNWCGLFPAWCGLHVGLYLEPGQCVPVRLRHGVAQRVLPSTYRAQSPDKWADAGIAPPAQVPHDEIAPGDIVTVVTGSGKPYGDHFAIVVDVSRDGAWIDTVEGNATGELGDGEVGRGVVTKVRSLADVVRVYRFDERHFEGAQ